MLVPIRMGTNMAAGNQQKHQSLEELKKNIKIILFQYKNRSDSQSSRNKSRNKSFFNQLGRHVNAASLTSLEIQAYQEPMPFGTKICINISFPHSSKISSGSIVL